MARPRKPLKHGSTYGYHQGCRCASCTAAIVVSERKTRQKHPATRKAWRNRNRIKINKQCCASKQRMPSVQRTANWRKSGIDTRRWCWADYERLLELQGFACRCCGAPLATTRDLCTEGQQVAHVDHDHNTGTVRGLLCRKCNSAAGYLRDDPNLAATLSSYLKGALPCLLTSNG